MMAVDGRGNRDNNDGAVPENRGIRGKADFGRLKLVLRNLPCVVVSRLEFLNAPFGDIKAHHVKMMGESDGEGQAHITEADDGQGLAAFRK